jgi:uncharacterized membrane protein YfcA
MTVMLGVLLIGAGIGFLSGAFGKGGSALATPLLHAIGVPAIVAIASPLPATIPTTLLASRRYRQHGHIDVALLRLGLAVGLPATAIGALLTRWIPGGPLVVASDVLVLVLGVRIVATSRAHSATTTSSTPASPRRVIAVIAVVGIASGLLGNSGGFLLVPLFISALALPVRHALGTSLALSAMLAIPGTIVHAWLGHIDWSMTLAFGLASVPFASIGATVALRAKEHALTLAYGMSITTLAGALLLFVH